MASILALADVSADAIVVWDWFFGLQREWRFVRLVVHELFDALLTVP